MKTAINITPEPFRCDFEMSCPAVFKTTGGTYYIIGKALGSDVSEIRGKVGEGEVALEISAELLDGAIRGAAQDEKVRG
jgi:hypothetical protein